MAKYEVLSEVYIAEGFDDYHNQYILKIGEAQNADSREKGLEDYLDIRKKCRLPMMNDRLLEESQRKVIEGLLRIYIMTTYNLEPRSERSKDYFICSKELASSIIENFENIINSLIDNTPFLNRGEVLNHQPTTMRRMLRKFLED